MKNKMNQAPMFLLFAMMLALVGCGTVKPVVKKQHIMSVLLAESSTTTGDSAKYSAKKVSDYQVNTSAVFAKFQPHNNVYSDKYFAAYPNGLSMIIKKEIKGFKEFDEDVSKISVLKSGFRKGMTFFFTMVFYTTRIEVGNEYNPESKINIKSIEGDSVNLCYSVFIVNTGKVPVKEMTVVDTLPLGATYLSSEFAKIDPFIPVNTKLCGDLANIKVDTVEKDGFTSLVFKPTFSSNGLMPSETIEIVVNMKMDKSQFLK